MKHNIMLHRYTDLLSIFIAFKGDLRWAGRIGTHLVLISTAVLLSSCKDQEHAELTMRIEVTEITSLGATFKGFLTNADPKDISEYGFVWGTEADVTKNASFSVRMTTLPTTFFSKVIADNLLAGVEYSVSAFAVSKNKTVYASPVKFTSLGSPGTLLGNYSPKKGRIGDTLTIVGKNYNLLATPPEIYFYDGDAYFKAPIVEKTSSNLKVIVPATLRAVKSNVVIAFPNAAFKSKDTFELQLAEITSMVSTNLKYCDSAAITWKSNGYKFKELHLTKFGAIDPEITPVKIVGDVIKFPLPVPSSSTVVQVVTTAYSFYRTFDTTVENPKIVSTSLIGDTLSIKMNMAQACLDIKALPDFEDPLVLAKRSGPIYKFLFDRTKCHSNGFQVQVFFQDRVIATTSPIAAPPPEIVSVTPSTAAPGDVIRVTIKNFPKSEGGIGFYASGAVASLPLPVSPNGIYDVVVPGGIPSMNGTVTVKVNFCNVNSSNDFQMHLRAPEIHDFNPKLITSHAQEVTITGDNFSPSREFNLLTIAGQQVVPVSATKTQLVVRMDDVVGINDDLSTQSKINLTVAGQSAISTADIVIDHRPMWRRLADFPGGARSGTVSFAINGYGYVLGGSGTTGNNTFRDFWKYDPSNDQWTQLPDFPGVARTYAAWFVVDNKAYVGLGTDSNLLGLEDFWEYNPATGQWTQRADYPGGPTKFAMSFVRNSTGFMGGGFLRKNLYQYNQSTDTWTQIGDLPLQNGNPTLRPVHFSFNEKFYYFEYNGSTIARFAFDPVLSSWTSMTSFPDDVFNPYGSFPAIVNGGVFVNFHLYNPESNTAVFLSNANSARTAEASFVIGNLVYTGLGYSIPTGVTKDFYVADVSR